MCSACSRSTAWLLALMKSTDRIPNHVIALEALAPLGLFDPRSDRFVITTQLPLHHPAAASAGDEDSGHAAAAA
jgi:hypothetical protein